MSKPCPFCGAEMKPYQDGLQHPYISHSVAGGKPLCYMNGTYIGGNRVEAFERRAEVHMEVIDGLPHFGHRGQPASLALVNQTIQYLAAQIPK